jgi:hypothetical protein
MEMGLPPFFSWAGDSLGINPTAATPDKSVAILMVMKG